MGKRIAVVGDAFVDILVPVGKEMPAFGSDTLARSAIQQTCGGSSCNTASQLASLSQGLGWKVQFFTAIGNDGWKEVIQKQSQRAGFSLHPIIFDEIKTGVCVVLSGSQDRGFVTYNGAMEHFRTEHLDPKELAKAEHIHFGGFFNIPGLWKSLPELLISVRKENPDITFSLDTNYDATSTWQYDWLLEILKMIDIFLPNDTEALSISGTESVEAALNWLTNYCKLAIVTIGKDGAKAKFSSKKDIYIVGSPSVAEVVDACGAGDAFNAAFLKAWLENGKDSSKLVSCMEYATCAGSLAIQSFGAAEKLLLDSDVNVLSSK